MQSILKSLAIFILSACAILLVVGSLTPSAQAQSQEASSTSTLPVASAVPEAPGVNQTLAAEIAPAPAQRDLIIAAAWVEKLPRFLRTPIFQTEGWQLIALLLIFSAGLILRKVMQWVLRARLAPVAQKFGARSVGNIVHAFAGPGSTLAVSALLAASYSHLGLSPWLENILQVGVRAMAILSIVVALYRIVDVLSDRMAAKAEQTDSKLDDQLVPLIRKALKIVVVLVGVLFLLQNLNVNVASLVAGLGIGGVAVALAAKDTIANFFGSLMIFVDRPFQIGDWVKIGKTEGVVEEVGFRSTRVRTFYNSLVTVPNAHFTEAAIDNIGLREFRRISTVLNLTYSTTPEQVQAFVEGVRAIIQANEYTRKDYYEIHLSAFGAHSLDVMVYLFLKVDSWSEELREKHNIFLEILRLAKELHVEFAFPTQTLHLDSLAESQAQAVPVEPPRTELSNVVEAFGPGGGMSRPHSPLLTNGYLAQTVKKVGGDG